MSNKNWAKLTRHCQIQCTLGVLKIYAKLGQEYVIALTCKLRTSFHIKFWNFWHITRLSIISHCKVIWSQKQSGFLAHSVYRANDIYCPKTIIQETQMTKQHWYNSVCKSQRRNSKNVNHCKSISCFHAGVLSRNWIKLWDKLHCSFHFVRYYVSKYGKQVRQLDTHPTNGGWQLHLCASDARG